MTTPSAKSDLAEAIAYLRGCIEALDETADGPPLSALVLQHRTDAVAWAGRKVVEAARRAGLDV